MIACASAPRCAASQRSTRPHRRVIGVRRAEPTDMPRRRSLEGPALARRHAAAARDAAPAVRIAVCSADHRARRAGRAGRADGRGPNRIDIGGAPVDVGFSIDLTIDPSLQALAQQTAACYTGRDDVCRALGMHAQGRRRAGGRASRCSSTRWCAWPRSRSSTSRAAASRRSPARSRRARARNTTGPAASAHCDKRLPYPIRYRPDALLNPAVFHDAMPGSMIKPIMAAAFLSDPQVGARWLAAERAELARAPTAVPSTNSLRGTADAIGLGALSRPHVLRRPGLRSLRAAVGSPGDGARVRMERRLRRAERAVRQTRPPVRAQLRCARRQRRRRVRSRCPFPTAGCSPSRWRASSARRFTCGPRSRSTPPSCSAAPPAPDGRRLSKDDWGKCSGGVVVDVVAEGWGQGHARASALGVAGMMAMLAAAANGQTEVRAPHLVESVHGTGAAGQRRP